MKRHEFMIEGGPERLVIEGRSSYFECFMIDREGGFKTPLMIATQQELEWLVSHIQGVALTDLLDSETPSL